MDPHVKEALAAISVIEDMYGSPSSLGIRKSGKAVCKPSSSELEDYVDVIPSDQILEAVSQ